MVLTIVKIKFESLVQKMDGFRPQKPKIMNLLRVCWKIWLKWVGQHIQWAQVKRIKTNWFNLKKIVIGTIQGDEFLYISHKLITNLISDCYSISPLISQSPPLRIFTLIYPISSFSSLPYTWTVYCLCWSLSHQHFPEVFGSSYKAEKHCSEITSPLMRLES